MIGKIEEIPKEELQREAAFVAAVAEGLKKQPEGRIVMIDCPYGGKIMAIPQRIRRTPNHDCKVQ